MGENPSHTPGSGYMDEWDSSGSSDTEPDVEDFDADNMELHRNLSTETTCEEDGSDLEGMGHKSDDVVTLTSTGLPSINEDQTTRPIGNGDMVTSDGATTSSSGHASNVVAALVLIPSVAFVLLLFVFVIFLWKEPLNRLWSRRNSVRSPGSGDMKEETGEVDQNLANPGPKQCRDLLNHTTDPNKDRDGTLGRPNALCEAQYTEVDENAQTIVDDNIPQRGNTSPSAYDKVDIESHGYADNDLRGTKSYDEKIGDDDSAERENRTDEGHEATNNITGPVYHTLDPNAHSHSSYMSVSTKKQDDGYDRLNRQQNQHQTKSKSDSGYDFTKRIGKNDAKLEPSNTTESGYSVLCSSSANTTAYDKLEH